ncbi:MAG TPA: glycogen debranching enzyme N-terminal domain-containing protein, partial [Thermomicrobiales bacterium]|nr:glycogen debranching enzyme N-terminal domain-containing protein [Thermomicrobiales bacterium]
MSAASGRAAPATVLDRPLVGFGRAVCGDLAAGLRREWLVTNGLGGYASGTVAGPRTRRYHGLLVAALAPPVERAVLVAGALEWATYDGWRYPLSAQEYGGGWIDPHGYLYLQSFALEGLTPVWTFALADALLERRVWMAHGANTTYVTYRLARASGPVELALTPLVTYRDFHTLSSGKSWNPDCREVARGVEVRASAGARPYRLLASDGHFALGGDWYWNFHYREETARGLD